MTACFPHTSCATSSSCLNVLSVPKQVLGPLTFCSGRPVLLSFPHLQDCPFVLPPPLFVQTSVHGVGWGVAACRLGWPSLIWRLYILLVWFWRSNFTGFQKGSASLDLIPYFTCRKVKPISFQAYKRLMLPHRPRCPDLPDSL